MHAGKRLAGECLHGVGGWRIAKATGSRWGLEISGAFAKAAALCLNRHEIINYPL